MSERLVSTLAVSFDGDDDGLGDNAGKNKIVLQQMIKRLDFEGNLWARCFPSRGVKFATSVGSLRQGEVRSQIMYEGLKFSDSSSVGLKFPAASVNIDSSRSVLMRKTTDNYGNTRIQPATGVTLRYDTEKNAVIAEASGYSEDYEKKPVKIYGACFVNYRAEYQMLYYTPKSVSNTSRTSFIIYVGTIFGYNNYTVETLDMELEADDDTDELEYCRVYAEVILDPDGAHYAPDGWPAVTGDFDPDLSFTDEATFHIHYYTKFPTLRAERYRPSPRIDGTPIYRIRYAGSPNENEDGLEWKQAYLSVDKSQVFSDMASRYQGLINE